MTNWLENRRKRVRQDMQHPALLALHPGEHFSETPIVTISGERQTGKTEMVVDRVVRHANEGLSVIYVSGVFPSTENTFYRLEGSQPQGFTYRRAHGETAAISPSGGRIDFRACTQHNFLPDNWDVAVFDDTKGEALDYVGERVKLIYRLMVG